MKGFCRAGRWSTTIRTRTGVASSSSSVNGRPDSFLYPLAAPRYARRKLETPPDELYTVPQLLDTTVDNLWGDEIGDSFGAGGLGLSGVGEGGGGRGEGIGHGQAHGCPSHRRTRSGLELAALGR